MSDSTVLSEFVRRVEAAPEKCALALPQAGDRTTAETVDFQALHARAERFAGGVREAGLGPGDRVILASPPSVDFFALALALIGARMTVVLLDGSMDRTRLLDALRSSRARAVVSTAAVLRRWPLVGPLRRMRRYAVDGSPLGVRRAAELEGDAVPLAGGDLDAPAIVSFTSGSTGRAKGVNRTGAILLAQHEMLAHHLPFREDDVDMPSLPAFVLHNLASGVTTVLPPEDLRRPASADPGAVAEAMRAHRVTTLLGVPAFVGRVADRLVEAGERLPSVRRVVVGAAPVPREMCRRLEEAFPDAETLVVYGSTEVEPIAHVTTGEVLASQGEGHLVGRAVPELDVEIVSLPDRVEGEVEAGWLGARAANPGEVVLSGPNVSREYLADAEANARNKVREAGGRVWHRTHDVAHRDADGRLWLLGRTDDAIRRDGGRVLHPLPLEAAVGELPGVRGAALVAHDGAPGGELAVVVDDPKAVEELLRESGLDDLPVRAVDAIPLDARHESKVDRAALRRQLERRR